MSAAAPGLSGPVVQARGVGPWRDGAAAQRYSRSSGASSA
jgi:hypothetical protein